MKQTKVYGCLSWISWERSTKKVINNSLLLWHRIKFNQAKLSGEAQTLTIIYWANNVDKNKESSKK
jgi:hypothetical protein